MTFYTVARNAMIHAYTMLCLHLPVVLDPFNKLQCQTRDTHYNNKQLNHASFSRLHTNVLT
jgi:hypothetical protein